MKNSRDSRFRRRSLTRRSVLKAGLGGTLASALTAKSAVKGRTATSSRSALLPLQRTFAQTNDAAGRTLATGGTGSVAILTDTSSSPFSGYLSEILSAEGVRDFTVSSVSSLSSVIASGPRAIILAPTSLSSGNATALEDFVAAGGGLIAMRPGANLNSLLGITSQAGNVSEGYVRITDNTVGGGLYADTMQFHGTSSRYALNGAGQVAALYSTRTSSTNLPAATINQFGSGQAAMLSYDLAHSVVLTRQGNPAQADQDTDGDGIVRSIDIYRNWIDLERSHVPQADIQQRLLVRLIDAVAGYPTPRLWYFPGTAPSVLVPTSDAHAEPDSYFQTMVDTFSQRGIGLTFFLPSTSPSASSVSQWQSQGFDFSVHPYVDQGFGTGYSANLATFSSRYGYSPSTARTHQVRWTGWSSAAEIESQFGIEMDFNSYQWGTWVGSFRGYLNGGGTPMRFVSSSGNLLSIYQQHTNLVDEQIAPATGIAGLTSAQANAISHQTIDECIDTFHTPITPHFHVGVFSWGDVNAWALETTDYALGRGALALTAAQWLAFIKNRAATTISNVTWSSNVLAFTVAGSGEQTVLIPLQYFGAALTGVTLNGNASSYDVLTVDGRSMAAVAATSGTYEAIYEADTTAPVITNVVAAPESEGSTITWTTDEAATSLVAYGLTQSLGSEATVPGLATAHNVVLSDLTPSTTYYFRVTSNDSSDNSSSSSIETFTTAQAGAPTLASMTPSTGQSGSSQNVTITGTNFVDGATATLGATALQSVTVANPTTIQATVPATLPVGQHILTVTNPDEQSVSLPNAYTVLAAPPVLEGVSPPVVPIGQQITLTGAGFISGAGVQIGAVAATNATVVSSTTATALVPLSLTAGTYSVTITNPDTQSDTLVNALTVSELPTAGHTTVADFAPGIFTDTETASGGDAGDGAVVLASEGWFDGFDTPGLDPSRWTSGTWVTGGSVTTSSGNLTAIGAWARSLFAFDSGKVTARITFASHAWLNFGLSRQDNLDNPWFLFGVPGWDTAQVYIRYNFNGGFANIPLPGLIGAAHDYAIVLGPGVVRFLVDGEEVHQLSGPALNPLATWLSSGTTSSQLSVSSVEIANYEQQGSFLSPALDAGQFAEWQQLIISASEVPATDYVARARSSQSGTSWSAWTPDLTSFPAMLSLPVGRYLQYELDLESQDGTATPVIGSVSGSYQVESGSVVGEVIVTPSSVTLGSGETQQFNAEVLDTNGDPLPGVLVTWSVVNGGGSVDQSGLFTSGTVGGQFDDTVVASAAGITGTASITVEVAPAPQITGIDPAVALVGNVITLNGQNLVPGTQVQVGATQASSIDVANSTTLTFVVPDVPDGLYDVTVTNPDGQFGTLVDALTVAALPTIGHTTVADFAPGTFTGTATASGDAAGDGAVVLESLGWSDSFDAPGLNSSLWASGTWATGGSVAISSGNLTVAGAWVRSLGTVSSGPVTARITFTSQAWINFGLSRVDTLDNPWFLFGVPGWDTSQVYARYNFNGGSANVALPGLIGTPHDYSIVLDSGSVRFLVDGNQVHQVAVPTLNPLATWISSGLTSAQLTVDSVAAETFEQQGSYLSPALDAGQNAQWLQLMVNAAAVPSTSFSARARTSQNGSSWSGWSPEMADFPAALALTAGRYLQYELELEGNGGTATPIIGSVNGSYQIESGPTVGSVIVSPAAVTIDAAATQQFSAAVLDTEGEPIPGAPVNWSVVNGGGSINQNGLFTAGTTGGNFVDTVVASSNGVTGSASVTVEVAPAPQIFDISPPVALVGNTITVTGQDFASGAQVHVGATQAAGVVTVNTTTLTFNVPSIADGTYNVTVTNPDGQFGSLQNALTVSSLNWLNHTTLSDFQAGTHDGSEALEGGIAGDGAVGLSNQGSVDGFDGSTLNSSLWNSGLWSTSGSLSVGSGQLTVLGGWVRSTSSFSSGTVVGRLTFSNTAWQNFGLSRTDNLDNPWFLFGVPGWDTSQVYVRYNFSGGQGNIPVPGLIGTPHDFAIQVGSGSVTFLVDGQQVHQLALSSVPNLAIWLSVGATSGAGTIADSMGSVDYQSNGTFTGQTVDASSHANWQQIIVDATAPSGTSASTRARTSTNGTTWSTWSSATTNSPVDLDLPDGRYLQYEIDLATTNGTITPIVQAVSAGYLPSTPPGPANIVISPASTTLVPGETQQFDAQVLDENGEPVPGAQIDWDVEAGGGTIDSSGLFTAGPTLGTYVDTVVATSGELGASATVTVVAPAAPVISDIEPGEAISGDLITITGTGFASGATVMLDTTQLTSTTVVNATTITFIAPALPAGVYDVAVTNPDQQADSVPDGLTISVPSVPVEIVQTTGADFGQGTLSDTEVTLNDNGEVRLASNFFDEFDGSTLSSDWTSGTYGSPGSAGVSGSQAVVSNGWIQSNSLLGETTVTARLTFANNGTPYLNFGFGAPGALDHPWFLFGIPGNDTSRIFARSNVPGTIFADQGINGVALNQPHDYSIRRRPGAIDYLIDGAVVATHTVNSPAATAPLAIWISSGRTGQQLIAEWFRVDEYPASGTFTSGEIDAGSPVTWQSASSDVGLPTGTSASIRVRTSEDGASWSAWSSSAALSGASADIDVADGRYIQYELTLMSNDGVTPEVRSVTLSGSTV